MEPTNQVSTAPRNYLYNLACLGTAALMAVSAAYGLATHQDMHKVWDNAGTGGLLGFIALMVPAAAMELGLFGRKDLSSEVGE